MDGLFLEYKYRVAIESNVITVTESYSRYYKREKEG